MCGRIALYSDPDYLARIFDADLGPDVDPGARPSWNVPPTRSVLAIADVPAGGPGAAPTDGPGGMRRELGRYRWGLVPPWARDPSVANRTFNARAETVASKPSFRAAFAARRLVVVADGFYEWRPGTGKSRQPFYFTRADGKPLALAGLWEQWWGGPGAPDRPGEDHPVLRTCTVITTEAGPDMDDIHDRMPVVLDPADLDEWLDPANRDKPGLESLLVAAPTGTLVHREVATKVGSVRNDGPELIEAVAPGP
ncbi:MAG: SOS response-associated peptidase [Acidimicrobiales bacterium]|jgi:putative SOS response-associated peptidase YedK